MHNPRHRFDCLTVMCGKRTSSELKVARATRFLDRIFFFSRTNSGEILSRQVLFCIDLKFEEQWRDPGEEKKKKRLVPLYITDFASLQ